MNQTLLDYINQVEEATQEAVETEAPAEEAAE